MNRRGLLGLVLAGVMAGSLSPTKAVQTSIQLLLRAVAGGSSPDPNYGPILPFGTPTPTDGWTLNPDGSFTHTPGHTAALKVPNANFVALQDYQLNFTQANCTGGSVDILMTDGASATFNLMTGTVDDNSDNWMATFEAPAGAAYIELRPTSTYDGKIFLQTVRKIRWEYTVPTLSMKWWWSWDNDTISFLCNCPTTCPAPGAPTVEFTGTADDVDWGFGSSVIALNQSTGICYLHDGAGGDCDQYLKISTGNQLFAKGLWMQHMPYPTPIAYSLTGGGISTSSGAGAKNQPSDFGGVYDQFLADQWIDLNEPSNHGDFTFYNRQGINLETTIINLQSNYPTYQGGPIDIINSFFTNMSDAAVDGKNPVTIANCEYRGETFRAWAIHGFDPSLPYNTLTHAFTVGETITSASGGTGVITSITTTSGTAGSLLITYTGGGPFRNNDLITGNLGGSAKVNVNGDWAGFRGQAIMTLIGCMTDDMAALGTNYSFFASTVYCTISQFNGWVGNRHACDAAQMTARRWGKYGDNGSRPLSSTNFPVVRVPPTQTDRNRMPFTKWGCNLRVYTLGVPGPYVDALQYSRYTKRTGPFPAGSLGAILDLVALTAGGATQFGLQLWAATHDTKVFSPEVVMTTGAGVGAELLTNGTFTPDNTGWTPASPANWTFPGGSAVHAAGSSARVDQLVSLSTTPIYRCKASVTISAGAITRQLRQSSGVNLAPYPKINFPGGAPAGTYGGAFAGYAKAISPDDRLGLSPSSAFIGSITNVSLQKVSLTGDLA